MTLFSLERISGPASEPVTVAEAKLHARIDLDTEDDLVADWIAAAREYTEEHCGKKWGEQTWKAVYPQWPRWRDSSMGVFALRLPFEPVTSVVSVKHYDTAGVQQTLVEDTDYSLWLAHSPPLIYPAPAVGSWPGVQTDRLDAIEVVFVAGYTGETIPRRVKQAIYLTLTYWSENRGDGRDPSKAGLPDGAMRLLDSMWSGMY